MKSYLKLIVLLLTGLFMLNPVAAAENVVYITSDNIYDTHTDQKIVTGIIQHLQKRGVNAVNYGIGPNKHIEVLLDKNVPRDAMIVNIYGGACAGTIKEMGTRWYKHIKGDKTVFTVFWAGTSVDITGLAWLPRAHDDQFSPPGFNGLAYPDRYLIKNGYGYVYSRNYSFIASEILKEQIE